MPALMRLSRPHWRKNIWPLTILIPPKRKLTTRTKTFSFLATKGVTPMTFLTPDDNTALSQWHLQHMYDPTEPRMPFGIAFDLDEPILYT